jgi:hypothetical protein
MRRVVLLALLALALPAVSLASTVDYTNFGMLGSTASLTFNGTTSCTTVTNCVVAGGTLNFSSQILDKNATPFSGSISVTTGSLVWAGSSKVGSTTVTQYTFTGGSISIWNSSSDLLFSSSFSGTLTVTSGPTGINYSLSYAPGGVLAGGFQVAAGGVISGDTIVTPEPGTLGLLGTGLVGLAGLVRRKLRG